MILSKIFFFFKNINFYIIALKTMFEKLKIDSIIRSYKLLYKNSQHYDSRIYNRFILNKIVII